MGVPPGRVQRLLPLQGGIRHPPGRVTCAGGTATPGRPPAAPPGKAVQIPVGNPISLLSDRHRCHRRKGSSVPSRRAGEDEDDRRRQLSEPVNRLSARVSREDAQGRSAGRDILGGAPGRSPGRAAVPSSPWRSVLASRSAARWARWERAATPADRGGDRNRTGVRGFAGPCLNHSATPPGDGSAYRSATAAPEAPRLVLSCVCRGVEAAEDRGRLHDAEPSPGGVRR